MMLNQQHFSLNTNAVKNLIGGIIMSFFIAWGTSAQNNALHFDGQDDRVGLQTPKNVPQNTWVFNFSKDQSFSIEIWVKPELLKDMAMVSKIPNIHQAGFNGYELYTSANGAVGFQMVNHFQNGNYLDVVSTEVLKAGSWTHIAMTYDGSSKASGVKIYLNGVAATLTVKKDNLTGEILHNGGITLGARQDALSKVFYAYKGVMDELRIWNKTLTADEITSRMNAEMAGNETNLAAYYSFNQGTPNGSNAAQNKLLCKPNGAYEGWLMGFALTGTTSNYIAVETVCTRK